MTHKDVRARVAETCAAIADAYATEMEAEAATRAFGPQREPLKPAEVAREIARRIRAHQEELQ